MGQRLILRKRIVSKGKYIEQLATKAGNEIISIFLVIVAAALFFFVAIMILLVCAGGGLLCIDNEGCSASSVIAQILGWAAIFAVLGALCAFASRPFGRAAKNTRIDVPLTRANTVYLPAAESLIRASQEPMQAQEGVLLRAAMETTPEQEEQLLRASGGHE